MQLRERLVRLKDLVGPEAILAAYGATREDLDMLAAAEEIIAKNKKTNGTEGPA